MMDIMEGAVNVESRHPLIFPPLSPPSPPFSSTSWKPRWPSNRGNPKRTKVAVTVVGLLLLFPLFFLFFLGGPAEKVIADFFFLSRGRGVPEESKTGFVFAHFFSFFLPLELSPGDRRAGYHDRDRDSSRYTPASFLLVSSPSFLRLRSTSRGRLTNDHWNVAVLPPLFLFSLVSHLLPWPQTAIVTCLAVVVEQLPFFPPLPSFSLARRQLKAKRNSRK